MSKEKNKKLETNGFIYEIVSLCPVCGVQSHAGWATHDTQLTKYICPICNGRHYGEPTIENDSYKCAKCKSISPKYTWTTMVMSTGEKIHGPIEDCPTCRKHLDEGRVAFIEIDANHCRTGRIAFTIPSPENEEAEKFFEENKAVFMNHEMFEKKFVANLQKFDTNKTS